MDWFINRVGLSTDERLRRQLTGLQGDIVEENKPKQVMYRRVYRVEDERPSLVTVKIYACSDNDNTGPSIREDGKQLHYSYQKCSRLIAFDRSSTEIGRNFRLI